MQNVHSENGIAPKRTQIPSIPSVFYSGIVPKERALYLVFLQEVNVRKITVSSDKHKFGVQLRAEPDNQTLGRRLKGAFKQVSQAIKGILCQNSLCL